jgi:hypothetical protein
MQPLVERVHTTREYVSLFVSSFIIIMFFGGGLSSAMLLIVNPACPEIIKIGTVALVTTFGMFLVGRGFLLEEVYQAVVS